MNVRRSSTERGEITSAEPTALGVVAGHWQVSQHVPIRRAGDTDRVATGWSRTQRIRDSLDPREPGWRQETQHRPNTAGALLGRGRGRQRRAATSARPP
jgi:hypothetical protein